MVFSGRRCKFCTDSMTAEKEFLNLIKEKKSIARAINYEKKSTNNLLILAKT